LNFPADAPLDPNILADIKTFEGQLPDIAPGLITRGYFHWAVAPFGHEFADYNAMVDLKGGKWVLVITHDPRDNAPGLSNNAVASHTWHRNTGALGVSIAGMDGATVSNFGPDPVELHELHYLCGAMAAICKKYGIDALGKVVHGSVHVDDNGNAVDTTGEYNLLTHAECAVIRVDSGTQSRVWESTESEDTLHKEPTLMDEILEILARRAVAATDDDSPSLGIVSFALMDCIDYWYNKTGEDCLPEEVDKILERVYSYLEKAT
jgi:hypothetical protein